MKVFIDTSVQVSRVFNSRWGRNDQFFREKQPHLSDYVQREFVSVVGGGFRIIQSCLDSLPNSQSNVSMLQIVLADVLQELLFGKRYTSNRQTRVAVGIIKLIISKWDFFSASGSIASFKRELDIWWSRLRHNDFFVFLPDLKPFDTRSKKTFIDVFCCPLAKGHETTCSRGKLDCLVSSVLQGQFISTLNRGDSPLNPTGLYENAISIIKDPSIVYKDGASIGQQRCFPLGDIFHLDFAISYDTALMTSDQEMIAAANSLGLQVFKYSPSEGSILPI